MSELASTPPGLTRRQREALNFIDDYAERNGRSPTYDEIRSGIGPISRSTAFWLVRSLAVRGYVRLHGRHRSIEVIAPFEWRWRFIPVDDLEKPSRPGWSRREPAP